MKKSELKSGVIISYITLIVGNTISIIYTPIMLRLLGQNEYGLMSLVSSVVSYLGLLGFGIGASFIRYNAKYRANQDKKGEANLNGMYIVIYSVIGMISFLLGIILVLNLGLIFGSKLTALEMHRAKILMLIMVFNVSISFPISVFGMYNNAYEKFIFGRTLALMTTVINPVLTLPFLFLGYGAIAVIGIQTSLALVNGALMIYYSVKHLKMKIRLDHFDKKIVKEIFIFSSFVFMNIVVDQINWNLDKFLLGVLVGTGGVAVYAIGAQFHTYYTSMAHSVSGVYARRINAIVAQKGSNNELLAIMNSVGRIQVLILGLILTGFVLVGKEFIYMWAGPEYNQSYAIALILLIPGTIPLIQYMGTEILRAMNKHQMRSVILLFVAIMNILISIPLCKLYGGIGCAIGTALSVMVGHFLFMNVYYYQVIKLDMITFWKEMFLLIPGLALCGVIGYGIKRLLVVNGLVKFVVFIVIYTLIYLAVMWFFMNPYEKEHVIRPLMKVKKKLLRS